MRYIVRAALLLLPVLVLTLAGCGSSSSGTANPFVPGTDTPTTPTGNGTVLSYSLALSVTPTSGEGNVVGPNSIVIATATLKDSAGNFVANQGIKFEAIEGAGDVTIDLPVVATESNGKAVNFLKAGGSTTSAVDVIIKASTTVSGQLVTSVGIFKIMRSESNIIKFITSKDTTDPDGTLNTLKVTLNAVDPPGERVLLQQLPFQILDNNGVPRSRVAVRISVYSIVGNCTQDDVFIDSPEDPEKLNKTVTTDDTGMGIFNGGVTLDVPEIGSENSCSVIYKAEATDLNDDTKTIFSYGGFIATLVNQKP
ncbi:MAG: hypothetical protein FPO08_06985 [Geobacter sp.]|nr:MAG: hypothetical protein FPO08_06985 [Geobacter sp.]